MLCSSLNRLVAATFVVAAVVFAIARAESDKPATAPTAPAADKPAGASAAPAPAANEPTAVEKALDRRLKLDFIECPLRDVCDGISKSAGINVLMDEKALSGVGITPDTPITRDLNISLRQGLRLMLQEHEMSYYAADDNTLVITSEAKAKERVAVRSYDVCDLANRPRTPGGPENDFELLTLAMRSCLSPEMWDAKAGCGTIAGLRGTLAVAQTADVHRQIELFLAALRKSRDLKPGAGPKAISVGPDADSPATEKIRQALDKRLDFNFAESPLKDVVEALRVLGIEVQLDTKALTDAGITADTPVTFIAQQIRVGTALKLLLQAHEMTFVIDNEVLLVTSESRARDTTTPVVYHVGDLVAGTDGSPDQVESAYQDLLDMIATTIDPTTWTDAGGAGTLVALPSARAIVCSQNQETQQQIAEFLSGLRNTRAVQIAASGGEHGAVADQIAVVRIYPLTSEHANAADDYIAVIRNLIAVKGPSHSDDFVCKAADAIVARCLPATHERIRETLDDLQGLPRPPLTSKKPAPGAIPSSPGAPF